MAAILFFRQRLAVGKDAFAEIVIWQMPSPVRASYHHYKYRLALIERGRCVLRYDNEAGKGDHRHMDGDEIPYSFMDVDGLLRDFWYDVDQWRRR